MPIRTTYTPLGRPAAYDVGEVVVELKSGASLITHLEAGYYEVSIIGAGGGAGGGSWKSGHKHAGGGGGSGAGFVGVAWLSGGSYAFYCGAGGAGGAPGNTAGDNGYDGGDTVVKYDGLNLIFAQGGAGGYGARNHYSNRTPSGRIRSKGGVLTINDGLRIDSYSVKTNGNDGVVAYDGAPGVAVDGVHGAGGRGDYKATGLVGGNGYIKVAYLGLEN